MLFLGQCGAWLATAIYAPSLALATVSGFPFLGCIVTVGFLSTLYTVLGGMKAVVWTDFVRFIVLAGGLLLMIGLLMSFFSWDPGAVWNRAGELTAPATGGPHTRLFDWSLDLSTGAWTPFGQDINWMWTAPSSSIVTFVTGYSLSTLVLDRRGPGPS